MEEAKSPEEKPVEKEKSDPKVSAEKPVANPASDAPKVPAAKPAAAKAKPAKKEAPPAEPLTDNGDGTVTDPNSGLMWKQSDAWVDMNRFYTWDDHKEYVDKFNKEKFAGYEDWTIPNKAQAVTLFDKSGKKQLMDKNGTLYPIDPIFTEGGASNTWITECSAEKIIRMDLKIGVDTPYPTADVWSSMRLVRPVPAKKE